MWHEPSGWLQKILPLPCCLCQLRSDNSYNLCRACADSLPWQQDVCKSCALPLVNTEIDHVCGRCLKNPPPITWLRAAFTYHSPLTELMYQFKFGQHLEIGLVLARCFYHYLKATGMAKPPDCLIPVPLHTKRLRERGYNQAAELAKALGHWLHIPVKLHACKRIKATAAQTLISNKARRANLRGAFSITKKLPAHIAIIDDVYTSGSTGLELAKMLKKVGVKEIEIWVIARAGRGRI